MTYHHVNKTQGTNEKLGSLTREAERRPTHITWKTKHLTSLELIYSTLHAFVGPPGMHRERGISTFCPTCQVHSVYRPRLKKTGHHGRLSNAESAAFLKRCEGLKGSWRTKASMASYSGSPSLL